MGGERVCEWGRCVGGFALRAYRPCAHIGGAWDRKEEVGVWDRREEREGKSEADGVRVREDPRGGQRGRESKREGRSICDVADGPVFGPMAGFRVTSLLLRGHVPLVHLRRG